MFIYYDSDEIWDFFEYFAHDALEYDNAFSHPSPDPCMMHATSLVESQIEGIFLCALSYSMRSCFM